MRPSRRDELIESSMRTFHRRGFAGSSLDVLLADAGVSRPTLYHHFKSKDDLIVAALELYGERAREKLFASMDSVSTDPVGRMLVVFDDLGSWFEEDDFAGCLFSKACAEFEDAGCRVREIAAKHTRLVGDRLTELAAQAGLPEPAAIAEQVNLLREGAIATARSRGEHSRADVAPLARAAAETLIDAQRSRSG
ncbi:MAG: TetR/AcrR family transcriptional regulator [Planctomycetota bacterium]